jgi:RNA polymerase sigma factor (sigma-70 family)
LSRLLDAGDPAAREAAWKAFLETHSRLLLHTARAPGGDYDAAMDAYAYVVEQLRRGDFQRLRAYIPDDRSRFTTWLVVVARRLCLDRLRERYGRPAEAGIRGGAERLARRRLVDLLAEELEASSLTAHTVPDNPEAQLRADELSRALAAALGSLEARDRLLLKLRFEDGLAARDISRIMGLATPFHVYRRLNTVLGRLRAALRERGIESPEP